MWYPTDWRWSLRCVEEHECCCQDSIRFSGLAPVANVEVLTLSLTCGLKACRRLRRRNKASSLTSSSHQQLY